MSPLLWNPDPKPPEQDDGKLVGAFVWLTFVVLALGLLGQLWRAS